MDLPTAVLISGYSYERRKNRRKIIALAPDMGVGDASELAEHTVETYCRGMCLDLAKVTELLEAHPFRFAKTMPKHPHWYTLRKEWDELEYMAVALYIRDEGYRETWWGKTYTYLDIGEHRYWTMGYQLGSTTVLNKAEIGAAQ